MQPASAFSILRARHAAATLVLCFALLPPFGYALAQVASVPEVATYTGADRQQRLEAAAAKEGSLVIYTIGTQIEPLIDRFQTKYPYVKVSINRASAADTTRRVTEEYRAGAYYVDVFEQPTAGMIVPLSMGFLQAYMTPEASAYNSAAIEKGHHWISVREGYIGLGFNTERIAPAEAPKTYEDLLDPKFRDRMAISGAASTAAGWIGTMAISKGDDFVRKLGAQDVRVYPASGRAVANLMISGEVALSPTIYSSHVEASKRQGAPLEWRALGAVPVTDTSLALAAKAPHPNAAMLYIDFMLSREAQLMLRDLGYLSARADMPPTEFTGLEKLYLANRPNYLAEFDHWMSLYQEVFLKGAAVPSVQE
ncbi:MAG TPA: extracellular solute-binding protein [Beijerinckiaceae bacterium]|jgi:iron(III) transport system substrate-binding protein|nr:extracellular solute-binding protein [Beijerinckiaceae bacterium]